MERVCAWAHVQLLLDSHLVTAATYYTISQVLAMKEDLVAARNCASIGNALQVPNGSNLTVARGKTEEKNGKERNRKHKNNNNNSNTLPFGVAYPNLFAREDFTP